MPNAKIVAIANHMDNQGKTTLTYCLAATKAKAGKMVLMIDLDFQCSLTINCGMLHNRTRNKKTSSCELFNSTSNLLACCFNVSASHIDKLFIMPASEQLAITSNQITTKLIEVFKNNLKTLRNFFDYIFIDVGPAINPLLISSLLVAESIITPVKPEPISDAGLDVFVKTIKNIQEPPKGVVGNKKLKFGGIVINKYRSVVREHTDLLNKLTNEFNVLAVIPDSPIVTKELEFGLPLTLAHPTSAVAKTFMEIASKL